MRLAYTKTATLLPRKRLASIKKSDYNAYTQIEYFTGLLRGLPQIRSGLMCHNRMLDPVPTQSEHSHPAPATLLLHIPVANGFGAWLPTASAGGQTEGFRTDRSFFGI